jgi:hypothetical protein
MSFICIRDRKEVLELSIEDVKKYHGSLALMAIGVGFRVMQAAFKELFGDEIPERKEISILSGHAGPGFRDVFEFVTRAVTREAYRVDINYPVSQFDPYRAQSYAYVISTTDGKSVEVSLRDNFLPHSFYDFLKKGRDNSMTEQGHQDIEQLKLDLFERAMQLPQDELLSVKRIS